MSSHALSPSATFERRIRAAVRGMQRLYTSMTREEAMLRVRQIPPRQLISAIKTLHSRYAVRRRKRV